MGTFSSLPISAGLIHSTMDHPKEGLTFCIGLRPAGDKPPRTRNMPPVSSKVPVEMRAAELAKEWAQSGLSKGELARRVGVSRPYISACLAGIERLSDDRSKQIREELRKAAVEKRDREDAMSAKLERLESLLETGPRLLANVPPDLVPALDPARKAGRLVVEWGETQDRRGRLVRRKMVGIVKTDPDVPPDALADVPLSTLRKAAGLTTPADAAEVTGVSVSLYRRWECDAQSPPRGRRERLVVRAEESLGRLGPEDLKDLREQACLSRAEAARRQGVSWTAVDSWETGSQWPSLANLARYVALLRSELAPARELLWQEATALTQLAQQVASDPGALSFALAVQWLGPIGGLGRASRTPALARDAIERGEFHLRPTDYRDTAGRLRQHDGLFLGPGPREEREPAVPMTAQELRIGRESRNMKQDVLARKLPGVSRGHISDWETGSEPIPETRVGQIRAVFDASPVVLAPPASRTHYTLRADPGRRADVLAVVRKHPGQYGWAELREATKIGAASLHRVVDPMLEAEEGARSLLHLGEVSYTDRHGRERVRLVFRPGSAPGDEPYRDLGPLIRSRRTALGWSLSKMAEYLGTWPQNLSKWELGQRRVPRPDKVSRRLAELEVAGD